jgi:hypothetical protein
LYTLDLDSAVLDKEMTSSKSQKLSISFTYPS